MKKISGLDLEQSPKCDFPITYSSTLEDGGSIPSFILFDATQATFYIQSYIREDKGNYRVKLIGSVIDDLGNTVWGENQFNLKILGNEGSPSYTSPPLDMIVGFNGVTS